ncbi:HAD family phosphatase [Agrobacterium vaccinii]|uniref:HAD family hydrolase n=1 Tax=Agrobacterium vaccinii TaxID=2735528 RepID=UPI001E528290|nr:HAD family phosphatase [Agrobacterium vaccinii]UHS61315.1 HAD family phosphatase [Agrobacterium vaccinii]
MALHFSGVVLDLDGLLLDTERLQFEVGPAVLRDLGYDLAPAFFRTLVGIDRTESARLINLELGASIDGAELDRVWNGAMDDRMRDGIPLRPGVHDFLDALDQHQLPRAIATNSVTARAEWKLEHAGLLKRIDAVVGVDKVARGKPAPDVYVAAAKTLSLEPSQCIALDDSDLGVRAALAAGIGKVIQIPDLVMSKDLSAHHQVDSLYDARTVMGM